VVGFVIFPKKVMGKYYRRASSEQRARFAMLPRHLLKTSGRSLLELDADRIKFLPFGSSGEGKKQR